MSRQLCRSGCYVGDDVISSIGSLHREHQKKYAVFDSAVYILYMDINSHSYVRGLTPIESAGRAPKNED
jgi:hypothetical protein